VWRRQQHSNQLDTISEIKKSNEIDSGFGKCETDVSTPGNSDAGDLVNSSQFNKIFIVSENRANEGEIIPVEPQRSSLYRIASRTQDS
jgi:hypothetical protein